MRPALLSTDWDNDKLKSCMTLCPPAFLYRKQQIHEHAARADGRRAEGHLEADAAIELKMRGALLRFEIIRMGAVSAALNLSKT